MRQIIFLLMINIILLSACEKHLAVAEEPRLVPPDSMVERTPLLLTKIKRRINDVFGGYFEGLPFHYTETKKNYPLLIWLHGMGQIGDGNQDIDQLGIDGIGKLLLDESFPSNFAIDGKNFSFIVLSPQYNARPTPEQVMSFLEYAKTTYRTDSTRIYLAGLSVGGVVVTETAARYPGELAAIAPMAGVMEEGDIFAKCKRMADANLPVWAFHNENDPTIPAYFTSYLVSTINGFLPSVPARLTLFNEPGHDAWTKALSVEYRENGRNVYEWMLQFTR